MKKYKIVILVILLFIMILLLFLVFGQGEKTIIGKWKSTNEKNEYYYIFNEDKTCSYEMKVARLDCTYEIDDNQITISYKGGDKTNTFKYRFDGKYLIINDENDNDNKFIRQKVEKNK